MVAHLFQWPIECRQYRNGLSGGIVPQFAKRLLDVFAIAAVFVSGKLWRFLMSFHGRVPIDSCWYNENGSMVKGNSTFG